MLVLSRKAGESIELKGLGSIHIEQIKGNRVQIGLQLPNSVKILRTEVKLADEVNKHYESGQQAAALGQP